jgi:UrcA family protein
MKATQRGMLAAVTLGALFAVSATAAAAPAQEDFTVRVSYSDLDIQAPAGAKTLYGRLQYASKQACQVGSYRELGSLQRHRDAENCYRDLLDELVAGIDSEALRELHDS